MKTHSKLLIILSFLGSVLFFTALAAYRSGDFGHVVSETNTRGGKARHGVSFSYGTPRFSILVTSKAKLDRTETLTVGVEGDHVPPFEIIGRNPAVLNLGIHDWHRIDGNIIRDVKDGENFAFYVVLSPPDKDAVCHAWVDAEQSLYKKEHQGKVYHFCSEKCLKTFVGNPETYIRSAMPTEHYQIQLTDSRGRKVLTVPVSLLKPGEKPVHHGRGGRYRKGDRRRPETATKEAGVIRGEEERPYAVSKQMVKE